MKGEGEMGGVVGGVRGRERWVELWGEGMKGGVGGMQGVRGREGVGAVTGGVREGGRESEGRGEGVMGGVCEEIARGGEEVRIYPYLQPKGYSVQIVEVEEVQKVFQNTFIVYNDTPMCRYR